jgi:hypothetical protein
VRSQLNRGRRLISAFVPALPWWRASRARMFHSRRHRSGLGNEAAILILLSNGLKRPGSPVEALRPQGSMRDRVRDI